MQPIKVLIVDDSELIRSLLQEILAQDSAFEVVGTAADPYEAREKIKLLNPDVITLDIEMPRMDGITFLRNLMRLRPMPVLMISTLTTKGAEITLEALELGAIDFIAKPRMSVGSELVALGREICSKLKYAARANISVLDKNRKQAEVDRSFHLAAGAKLNGQIDLIAIGASTGGTEATKDVISQLPAAMPPIAIVQHMPDGFTASYAKRLDSLTPLKVEEFNASARPLLANHIYVANGAHHMVVLKKNGQLLGYLDDREPVNRHKPSVDVLFDSVARYVAGRSIGVLLTGMGMDGAKGMGVMRNTGALTIAQDERTSVVWGMPRVAIEQGAAKEVLPIGSIGQLLIESCYKG